MFVPSEKVVVEVALNEQTAKATNPNVPISAEEIAESALAAADAGAAMVHFHVRHPQSGRDLGSTVEGYAAAIRLINESRPDLLVNVPYGHGRAPRRASVTSPRWPTTPPCTPAPPSSTPVS